MGYLVTDKITCFVHDYTDYAYYIIFVLFFFFFFFFFFSRKYSYSVIRPSQPKDRGTKFLTRGPRSDNLYAVLN